MPAAPPPALTRECFWFLRHGQTDWNRDNLAQGSVDVPLNQHGIEQAHAASGLLLGRGIATVTCSPLLRARVTAEIVAARLALPVSIETDLHEASFGVMEAKPMLAPWFADWIGGVSTPEGAEPFSALITRAITAVNHVLASNPTPVLVIAHGALFRALRAAMGLRPDERLMNAIPQQCCPGPPGEPWTLLTPQAPAGAPR